MNDRQHPMALDIRGKEFVGVAILFQKIAGMGDVGIFAEITWFKSQRYQIEISYFKPAVTGIGVECKGHIVSSYAGTIPYALRPGILAEPGLSAVLKRSFLLLLCRLPRFPHGAQRRLFLMPARGFEDAALLGRIDAFPISRMVRHWMSSQVESDHPDINDSDNAIHILLQDTASRIALRDRGDGLQVYGIQYRLCGFNAPVTFSLFVLSCTPTALQPISCRHKKPGLLALTGL